MLVSTLFRHAQGVQAVLSLKNGSELSDPLPSHTRESNTELRGVVARFANLWRCRRQVGKTGAIDAEKEPVTERLPARFLS
jgi:hypothetical protein